MDLVMAYRNSQGRLTSFLHDIDSTEEGRVVPSCPAWTVHDLVAHLSGTPECLANGDFPQGDFQPWLDRIVDERRDVPIGDLLDRWSAVADAAAEMAAQFGGLLTIDAVTHEQDVYGALGRPAARDSAELAAIVPLMLEAFTPALEAAGLGPMAVETPDGRRWQSHDGDAGYTLRVDVWEASRALESRRTRDELRALPHDGDVDPYIDVIAGHLPLPERSLGE